MQDKDFEQAIEENAKPFDEYLDGLIAKATPQWAGVDVDAFMDKVRGREREPDAFIQVVRRGEGDEMNDYIVSLYPEWADVLKPQTHD